MPAKNAPSANDTPNSARRAVGDADRGGDHAQREQLARAGARDLPEQPRQDAPPDDEHQRDEGRDLRERDARACATGAVAAAGAPCAAEQPGERRQQHQHQHHGEVLDHQPADGDAAVHASRARRAPRAPQQHDGARAPTATSPKHQRRAEAPAPQRARAPRRARSPRAICTIAPGTAMRRTASRSPSEKCRPTPNISSITPISASCAASATSATKPGVAGPMSDAGERGSRPAPAAAAARRRSRGPARGRSRRRSS